MNNQDAAKAPPTFTAQADMPGSGPDAAKRGTVAASSTSGSPSLSETAQKEMHDLKDAAGSLSDDAKQAAAGLANSLKDKAREIADQQKAKGSDQIDDVAHSIRGVADELGKQMPAAAGYVRDAAEGVEQFSSSLRNRSVDDLLNSAYRFARAQPLAFFGASVLAGFAVSRFLKSSAGVSSHPYGPSSHHHSDDAARWHESTRPVSSPPTAPLSAAASKPVSTMHSSNAGRP